MYNAKLWNLIDDILYVRLESSKRSREKNTWYTRFLGSLQERKTVVANKTSMSRIETVLKGTPTCFFF